MEVLEIPHMSEVTRCQTVRTGDNGANWLKGQLALSPADCRRVGKWVGVARSDFQQNVEVRNSM